FVGILVLVLIALLIVHASAHDRIRPDLHAWFTGLKSHKGLCCDGSDALHLRDVDWDVKDGHYRVRIPKHESDLERAVKGETVEAEWVDVPKDAVVDEPNLDGATLVWPIYYYGHLEVGIRCFMPGSMT